MTGRALLTIAICFSGFWTSAQELRNFDYYFAHAQVSQDAKEYYARLFDINNSDKTYSILDSAFTQNTETRPFYIYLICKMLPEAEPSLMKELNIVCRYMVEHHPADLVAVLFAGPNYVEDRYKAMWAHRVAVELRVSCNSDLMTCFKKSRSTALENFTGDGKSHLEVFYNMIRKDMNLFQQH